MKTNLDRYITKNYLELQKITRKITNNHELTDDLCHYVMVIVMTKLCSELVQKMIENNQLKYYIIAIIHNQWNSSTSPFYKEYRKFQFKSCELSGYNDIYTEDTYDSEKDNKIELILELKEKQKFYMRRMVELKFDEDLTYKDISFLTKIPSTSCWNTIQSFKRKVLKEYKRQNNKHTK